MEFKFNLKNMDMNKRKNMLGFTIVELMIAVALLAILASLAAPSFTGVLRQNRLAAQSNGIIASLNYARSETIVQNNNVVVQPVSGNADWSTGWQVQVTDNAGVTTPLRFFEGLENASLVIFSSPDASTNAITFGPDGTIRTPNNALGDTVLRLTPDTCPSGAMNVRAITINPAGAAAVTQVACP